MTLDEILNMPASREMDAEIAERIMGLVSCQNAIHLFEKEIYCHATPEYPDQGGETKAYSTDIADAWEVVEKMRGAGHEVYISTVPFKQEYSCTIIDDNGEPDEYHRITLISSNIALTAPLAICRAALLAAPEGKE